MRCKYDTSKTKSECYVCALSMTRRFRGGGNCPVSKLMRDADDSGAIISEHELLLDFICDNMTCDHCEFEALCPEDAGTDECCEYILSHPRPASEVKE